MGRKLFDGKSEKEVLQKLENVWAIGGTDIEACLSADISVRALEAYQTKNQKFLLRKNLLKSTLNLLSRQTIAGALKNRDVDTAKWYLERKKSDEFAIRNRIEHSADQTLADWLLSIATDKTKKNDS